MMASKTPTTGGLGTRPLVAAPDGFPFSLGTNSLDELNENQAVPKARPKLARQFTAGNSSPLMRSPGGTAENLVEKAAEEL
jgi:hypothetical protein